MPALAVLALDSVVAFDLTIPCQVFAAARRADSTSAYEIRVCAERTVTVTAWDQETFQISSRYGLDDARDADTVIVPGVDPDRAADPNVLRLLQDAADRGARVASICTGAFVLAAAGLLDGRRATTHWRLASQLAETFPNVEVDPSVLFVDEGQVLTSAGVAAGLDLCLHMVRRDLFVLCGMGSAQPTPRSCPPVAMVLCGNGGPGRHWHAVSGQGWRKAARYSLGVVPICLAKWCRSVSVAVRLRAGWCGPAAQRGSGPFDCPKRTMPAFPEHRGAGGRWEGFQPAPTQNPHVLANARVRLGFQELKVEAKGWYRLPS